MVRRAMLLGLILCAAPAAGQTPESSPPDEPSSKFRSAEDGWVDISGFLDEKYGFLPIAIPITEPAVGYGLAGGLAFISAPLGGGGGELGRPDITFVGGLGTENGTWGGAVGDLRHWDDDRVQTLAGVVHASVNLDFHGIGADDLLEDHPLGYGLEPTGGLLQGKVRIGDSRLAGGLGYAFASTKVTFDAPDGTPGLPDFERDSDVGGMTPSLTYDTRDNIFTPLRGTYVEGSVGFFSAAFGGDDEFQRGRLIAMHFVPLSETLFLGVRGDAAASFGDTPFYLKPFISLRGAPVLRFQGEETAQIEAELRWQCWKRVSVVGFAGAGATWNEFERLDDEQSIFTGGGGLRYELARKYGVHAGIDVAVGPDTTAVYIQVGSAWARP